MTPDDIVGKPSEREVWLAPDWSSYKPITAPQPSGWTRVSVRDTAYADGRIVTEVLDAQRNPIKSQILDQKTDNDQAARFAKDDASRNPPGGVTTKRVMAADGKFHIYGWNPDTKQYDDDQGAVESSTTTAQKPNVVQVEGTPDGNGGFDNSRPVMASHWPDGRVTYEPLTGPERAQWERDKNGGKTDAELANPPAANLVGTPTGNTRQREAGGQQIKETEYVLPDGRKEWRTQTAPAAASSARTPQLAPDKKSWGYFDTTDPNNPKWVTLPAAQAPPLPGEPDKPPVQIEGVYGEWKRDAQGNAQFVPVEKQPGANPGAAGPPMPVIVLGQSEAAIRQYADQLAQEVAAGRMTPSRRDALLEQAFATANLVVAEATVVQRGIDSHVHVAETRYTGMMNGMQNALAFVMKINGDLPVGSDLGGKAFAALLGLQMITMDQSGINDVYPPGTKPPTVGAPPPVKGLTNPGDPKAVEADREAIMAHPLFSTKPPDSVQPPPTPDSAAAMAEAQAQAARAAAGGAAPPVSAAAVAAPATPAGPPAASIVPNGTPNPGPVPGQDASVWTPSAPPPAPTNLAPYQDSQTAPALLGPEMPTVAAPAMPVAPSNVDPNSEGAPMPPSADDTVTLRHALGQITHVPRSEYATWPPFWRAQYTEMPSDGRPPDPDRPQNPNPPKTVPTPVGTPTVPTDPQGTPAPVTQMAPDGGFAVLQQPQFMKPMAVGDAPSQVPLQTQAASLPPWKFTPEQIAAFKAAGIPDSVVWSVPGRSAVA